MGDYRQPHRRRIVKTGPLSLLSQKDSFAAPDIMIDKNSMGELLWDLCKRYPAQYGTIKMPGRWRFTLEQIPEKQPPAGGYQPKNVDDTGAAPPREE
jgi:hypothetical protein